jgi:hypothetical protein
MDAASGVRGGPEPSMAPYPLYGIPGMGDEPAAAPAVPLWKKPWFCYSAGAAAGFGLAYAFFGWFKPKYMKKNVTRRKKKAADAEE